MITQNLHTHTVFDDGKNTPMEMARAALDAGLASLGFSGHSVLPYENNWSLAAERLPAYLAAVAEAKAACAGRLAVYSGLEWDGISPQSTEGFDYIIGSLHHLRIAGQYPCVEATAAITRDVLARFFGGDRDVMVRAFFAQYGALAREPAVDIVGHFDVISKFDETDGLFDAAAPAYRDAAMAAMEALLKAGKIFEVNTGAMSRGYRSVPYPALPLLRELKAHHARICVASDAHSTAGITYAFAETEALLRDVGFREIWQYTPQGFAPVGL